MTAIPSLTSPDATAGLGVVRALDLTVRRRVENLLAGDHLSTLLGPGTELAQVRAYQPGDDVRQMDWAVTARTRMPHVKVHVAERALTTWLVLDASPSMAFGTADHTKAQVAHGVALTIAHLATRGSNRLAVTTFGGHGTTTVRPTQGRAGLLHLLAALRDAEAAARAAAADEVAGRPAPVTTESLGQALVRTARLNRQRGLVVIVADMRGEAPETWRPALLALAAKHDVLVVEVGDPREQELPDVGELWLVDPETGRQLRVDTRDRRLRRRFAEAASAERAALAREIALTGADHVVLSTRGDWLPPLVTSLLQRKQRR